MRNTTTPGATGLTATTTSLALPVYVCAARVNCTAANGTLNPNNPFAALGQTARIVGRLSDPTSNEYFTKAYRFASGLSGSFGNDYNYSLEGTYMRETLRAQYDNYIFVQHLLDVVADGSYNFVNPAANSQAVRNYLTPELVNHSNSEIYQIQGSVSKALFDLPGGPFQVGVGAAYRHELVDSPSANPDDNGPTNRYFTDQWLRLVGSPQREVGIFRDSGAGFRQAGDQRFGSLRQVFVGPEELLAKGRCEVHSDPPDRHSRHLFARLPYSELRRIGCPADDGFHHGDPAVLDCRLACAALRMRTAHVHTGGDAYAQAYSLGLTTVGTPGLKPEKSRNFTGGLLSWSRSRWLSAVGRTITTSRRPT